MGLLVPIPPNLTFHHPAVLLSTWFGVGLLRPAPGTLGSLAALPFGWALLTFGGRPVLLGMTLAIVLLGLWASHVYAQAEQLSDPASVVIDEVAGQWIALIAAPLTPLGFALAFLIFRFYDILKPWPVDLAERRLPGAWGIMGDDIIAGIYAMVVMFLIDFWLLS